MSTDDRGGSPVSGKDDLQRAVDERVAAVEEAAGSEPVVNAAPAKKTAKRAAAKKAAPAKAPAKKAPAAKKSAAKTPAKRTRKAAGAAADAADESVTANPVV